MTSLSQKQDNAPSRFVDLSYVARFSLLAFAVTFIGNPSCLITSTTDFPEPTSSPPFVDANTALATPRGGTGVPVTRLMQVDSDTQEITL